MGVTKAIIEQREDGTALAAWRIDENNEIIVQARKEGINVEKVLGEVPEHNPKGVGWANMLRAEIEAKCLSREYKDWHKVPSGKNKALVRAILAEQQASDLWHEVSMLKQRLKQADGGKGDWVEERDALLAQISALEAKQQESTPDIEALHQRNARQAGTIHELQEEIAKYKQRYNETANAIANENMKLHGKLAEWEEPLEQQQVRIGELEEKLEETVQAYHNAVKQGLQHAERADKAENELAGYKAANKRLVEANEKLQDELDRTDSAGLREAPDEVAWLRSRVEYLEGKLR